MPTSWTGDDHVCYAVPSALYVLYTWEGCDVFSSSEEKFATLADHTEAWQII